MERTEIARILREMLAEETGEEYGELDDSTTLREGLQLDSVDMISLLLHMEVRLGIEVASQEFENVETIGALLDLLQTKLPPQSEAA